MEGQPKLRFSRRKFGRSAAMMAAAFSAAAQQNDTAALPPEQAGEVEARFAEVIRRYGDRLSEAQRQHVRRILTQNERMLARIREYPLDNGDTPATVLKLAEGRK